MKQKKARKSARSALLASRLFFRAGRSQPEYAGALDLVHIDGESFSIQETEEKLPPFLGSRFEPTRNDLAVGADTVDEVDHRELFEIVLEFRVVQTGFGRMQELIIGAIEQDFLVIYQISHSLIVNSLMSALGLTIAENVGDYWLEFDFDIVHKQLPPGAHLRRRSGQIVHDIALDFGIVNGRPLEELGNFVN